MRLIPRIAATGLAGCALVAGGVGLSTLTATSASAATAIEYGVHVSNPTAVEYAGHRVVNPTAVEYGATAIEYGATAIEY